MRQGGPAKKSVSAKGRLRMEMARCHKAANKKSVSAKGPLRMELG